MKRRLMQACSIVSLLLAIATAGLWVRSHFAVERLTFTTPTRAQRSEVFSVSQFFGEVSAYVDFDWFPADGRDAFIAHERNTKRLAYADESSSVQNPATRQRYQNNFGLGQFEWESYWERDFWEIPGVVSSRYVVYVPHWFVVLGLLILPVVATTQRLRRQRRVDAGHCTTCGYDLRATPKRCPECGTVAAEATR